MNETKTKLLDWIDGDRDTLIDFLSRFIQAKSPNPPGDTREAAAFLCRFLDREKLPYRMVAPQPEMPNLVASFDGGAPGHHLVLNGHMDVFPVGEEKWTHDPWSGEVADSRIYGRGACDMKCGLTASVFTFLYLNRIRGELKGRLTLTAVSDEETFGPWGTRYLMEHHPEVHGDCCLSGEPGGARIVLFGQKGLLWLAFTVETPGCHGAYTHLSENAINIATKLFAEMEDLTKIAVQPPEGVARVLNENQETIDRALGQGASGILPKVTVNLGTIRGGMKVNLVPGHCRMEVDLRLPVGLDKGEVLAKISAIVEKYPQVVFQELNEIPSNWSDPEGEMVGYLRANVKALKGFEPAPILTLGCNDTRLWRYQNIPAYIYGPSPNGMGSSDENVEIDEFLDVVKTHVLSAYDYLTR